MSSLFFSDSLITPSLLYFLSWLTFVGSPVTNTIGNQCPHWHRGISLPTQHLYYLKFCLHCQVFFFVRLLGSHPLVSRLKLVYRSWPKRSSLILHLYYLTSGGYCQVFSLGSLEISLRFSEVLRLTHQPQHTKYTTTKRKCQVFSEVSLRFCEKFLGTFWKEARKVGD